MHFLRLSKLRYEKPVKKLLYLVLPFDRYFVQVLDQTKTNGHALQSQTCQCFIRKVIKRMGLVVGVQSHALIVTVFHRKNRAHDICHFTIVKSLSLTIYDFYVARTDHENVTLFLQLRVLFGVNLELKTGVGIR